jgi:uncharacterized protein YraI
MRRTGLMLSIAAALAAAPMAASAQSTADALDGAEIYAGPGQDYPMVARLGPGVAVRVQGCLSDYTWCDVTFGPNRGWVYGGELGYAYQSRRVPIVDYGPRLALPVISFTLGNYWDRYYRGRNFYHERNDWERRWHDNRGGHEWRGTDRRGDWNRGDWNRGNGRRDNDRRNDYRGDNRSNGHDYRNDYRNDNNRGNRGNRVDGNLHGDGRGGYTPNINANRADQPGSAPNFDNGAGHQQ